MKVVWTDEASRELAHAQDMGRLYWPGSVGDMTRAMLSGVERVRDFPFSGREGALTGTRELVMTRYPFTLVYRVKEETLTVLRMYHQSKRWPERGDGGS